MNEAETVFQYIVREISQERGVNPGKMMTSPGIRYDGKVFAFFWNNKMVFKLGKDRDLSKEFNIAEFSFLNPFKNKPPMKGWYVVEKMYKEKWPDLAKEALSVMKK